MATPKKTTVLRSVKNEDELEMAPGSAVKALEAESQADLVSFEFDGDTYEYDRDALDDVDILEMFEDNKLTVPLRSILGAKQWATFKKKKRNSNDLGEFAEVMFEALGVKPGE